MVARSAPSAATPPGRSIPIVERPGSARWPVTTWNVENERVFVRGSHKTLGEEPAAVVHLKPGGKADEAELKAFVRERLAAFKVPVKVVFWPETLPRNANGKIVKTELKKVFEGEA